MSYLKEHEVHVEKTGNWSGVVVNISSFLGEIQVVQCDDCDHVEVHCLHAISTWKYGDTALLCELCGEDGT